MAWYADGAEAETRAGDGMGRVTEEDVEDALLFAPPSGDGHVAGGFAHVWSAAATAEIREAGARGASGTTRDNLLLDLDDEDEGGR